MIKDLPEDEVPDFWKNNQQNPAVFNNRMTIKEIVLKVVCN
jgi:hypothetical protein